jgi:AMMECR1 domain-containing protein
LALCLGLLPAGRASGELSEPGVPTLSEAHREFLSRAARRTIRDAILGREVYEPVYVPATLDALSLEVVVRLRQRGYLRAAGAAGPAPVAQAARDAATAAFTMLRRQTRVDLDLLNDLLIEIEVVGPPQPLSLDTDWTKPRAVDPYIEPGLHGIVLLGPDAQHRMLPTEIYASDMTVAKVLETWAQTTQADPSSIGKTRLMRFRSVHWYQQSADAEIVSLHRGLTLLPLENVSPTGLDEAVETLAQYMIYRQLSSGLFTYQYEPAVDRYSEGNNVVRQVGATGALALHAAWSGKSASLAAADIGIRYHRQGLVEIPDVMADIGGAAFVATADKRNKLGVTALLCIAMSQHPNAERFTPVREKLINGMSWLQRPSGMFMTAFPPAESVDAQDYFPGEALLAMALYYNNKPSGRILEAFDRAISFYRSFFRDRPSPAFVPWQVQAYTLMATHGKRGDYIDYVFELTDWLAEKQLTPSNCKWPEMWGGIASYQQGRAGVATAAYLEGFADALSLAKEVGDTQRAARYETLVRNAARFVMQLQFRAAEAYYVRSPQDAIGGIRTAPALNLLRIDHCQHALVGLIKARQVLFPKAD